MKGPAATSRMLAIGSCQRRMHSLFNFGRSVGFGRKTTSWPRLNSTRNQDVQDLLELARALDAQPHRAVLVWAFDLLLQARLVDTLSRSSVISSTNDCILLEDSFMLASMLPQRFRSWLEKTIDAVWG